MLSTKFGVLVLLGIALLVGLPACGGGGGGSSGSGEALRVASTSIPSMFSGQEIDHVIPLAGGCGGPYVMKVIQGQLPPGVHLEEATHGLHGFVLADGTFTFTIQIDDTGCKPFASTTAEFTMVVAIGDVVLVEVLQDLEPGLIPPRGEDFNPDYPALPTVVYNDFTSLDFVVAGGSGPYSMKLRDDPTVPDDGNLPTGVSIPAASTSIVGAPVEVGPNGRPFKFSVEIKDSVGRTGYATLYWVVDTPPIIIASESIADGQAGVQYSDQFFVVEGVPPFVHELVEQGLPPKYTSDKNPDPENPDADVLYNPGAPPTVRPSEALVKIDATYYPAPTDVGPAYDVSNPGVPSEGIFLIEESGAFTGIPRRRGTFSVNYHVQSTLVPNSFGQHAWASFSFAITESPPVVQDPAYTIEGVFSATPPYAHIPDAEYGVVYNPDGVPPDGLQILATGGVPADGRTDAPHRGQTATAPGETNGAYLWSINWDPDSEGNQPIPSMELTGEGVFRIVPGEQNNLVTQGYQALGFAAEDYALPEQLASGQEQKVQFSIGPDRYVVTQSSTSFTYSTDNRAQNDTALTVKVLIPKAGAPDELRAPNDTDLVGVESGKIGLPSEAGTGTTLAELLTTIDITRVSVNPTGYWDDGNHLNPRAARPFQHGDRNWGAYYYYGIGYPGTSSYTASGSNAYYYQIQPTATAVRLPKTPSVTANPASGVYSDGGKLYVFDSQDHFGIFILRKDGKFYVPAAFEKDTSGWVSFGDNWNQAWTSAGSSNSNVKIPQMTVSPDGRFAAFKLRTDEDFDQYETADSTAILLVSLTGERISAWDGAVYKIIDTGSDGSASEGEYQFASSLTLTDRYLYYLIGSRVGSSTNYLSWRDHYIYRYDLLGGADEGALLSSSDPEWANTAGKAMQTPFQLYARTFSWDSGSYGLGPDPLMIGAHGHNAMESSFAPHPFRVSANGKACAILAGETTSATSSGSDILFHHVWVDFEGSMHRLSSQRRYTSGGGRGIHLAHGPMWEPAAYQWGTFNGPTSRFEISDDGEKVAVVYYRGSTNYGYATYSSPSMYRYREDIAAYTTTNEWASTQIHEITGDTGTSTSPSTAKFRPSITWRFGALTFTAEGDGLVFWGGYSHYSPTATYSSSSTLYYGYYASKSFIGSLYSYEFASQSVKNILSSSDGGCNQTVGANLTAITFSTSSWQTDGGVIKPYGGFLSMNRNFLYIVTHGAVTSSSYVDGTLIGVNIRSLDTSRAPINGHTDGRAFKVGGFDSNAGFYPYQYYLMAYGIGHYYYTSNYTWYYTSYGDTQRAAATDNGWIYFVSQRATNGYSSNYQSYYYGGSHHYTYYESYTSGAPRVIYVFDPNVGGSVQQIAGTSWGSGMQYHNVNFIEVSDDGSKVAAVDTNYYYYYYNLYQERLNTWSGIQLDSTGALVGEPTHDAFHSNVRMGSNMAFTPLGEGVIYAQGAGGSTSTNENGKSLRRGLFGAADSTGYSFGTGNWSVLHAGR